MGKIRYLYFFCVLVLAAPNLLQIAVIVLNNSYKYWLVFYYVHTSKKQTQSLWIMTRIMIHAQILFKILRLMLGSQSFAKFFSKKLYRCKRLRYSAAACPTALAVAGTGEHAILMMLKHSVNTVILFGIDRSSNYCINISNICKNC